MAAKYLSKPVSQWLLVEEAASLQMWKIIVIVTLFTGHVETARIAPLEHLTTKKECAPYLAEHGVEVGTGAMIFAQQFVNVGGVVSLKVTCARL